jgi:hypothetical protein
MNFLVDHAASLFGTVVFPTIVAVGASGIALTLVGIGVMVFRAAVHS